MNVGAQPLYDLDPLLQLLSLGGCIALLPLAWVFWRNRGAKRSRRWQALAVLTLFLTFDLVLFGAFTRLTDSGLGCPDWPGCYGNASPLGAHADISAAQTELPTGPVTHHKAWVEMVHRYLATSVGALITIMAARAWWLRWRSSSRGDRDKSRLPSVPWATFTLVWVCLQGLFGALTVTMKLFPAIVTLHLMGGFVLLALLCVQAVRQSVQLKPAPTSAVPTGLYAMAWFGLAVLAIQVLLGGWVSTNYAVLVCGGFPTCQGRWWPEMNFVQAFDLWRPLGLLSDGRTLDFSALTAIHYMHRLFAYCVFIYLGWLGVRLAREPYARARLQGHCLLGLLALQFATGLSNVVLDWPLVAAVLHTGGAAALVIVLTWSLEEMHLRGIQRVRPSASGGQMREART